MDHLKKYQTVLLPELIRSSAETTSKRQTNRGKVVLAMVEGEVHDIGKTVIRALFRGNGLEVIDLGVLATPEDLVAAIKRYSPLLVGLSCMLTSSLEKIREIATVMNTSGFDIPLLLGGPGLTAAMTSSFIAPLYNNGMTLYVKDLHQCQELCHTILSSDTLKPLKAEHIKRQKEEAKIYFAQQEHKKVCPLNEARQKRMNIDWSRFEAVEPSFLGTKHLSEIDLAQLTDLIDWTTIFLAFGLKGKYPVIFNDPEIGVTAKEIFEDGQALLKQIIEEKRLRAKAVIGFFPANSSGDDIELYNDGSCQELVGTLHTLRQQVQIEGKKPYYALSDFIAPKESGKLDYLGAFALSCGFGAEELCATYEKLSDDYHVILVKVLADCLAESFAEYLHQRVRKEYWGYAADEKLTKEEMFRCQFQGIRPAPGYPACPEHSEKSLLFELLDVKNNIGMELTSSYAMRPAASVCGFYFAHPLAKYFWLGTIGHDQIKDYAQRKNKNIMFVEQQLQMHLNYFKEWST